jgi:hypothetical protein
MFFRFVTLVVRSTSKLARRKSSIYTRYLLPISSIGH